MTPIELRRKVLEKLQVVAAGEPVDAGDGLAVQAAYESLHEVLLQDNLIGWVVTEEVPTEYEWCVISMLAAELVDTFYCPPELKTKIFMEGKYDMSPTSLAEKRLRRLSATGFSGEPAESEYF